MSFKSVMVHVDLERPSDARITIARDLAELCGAGVIGIAAAREVPLAYSDGYAASTLIEAERKAIAVRLAKAESRFHSILDRRAKFVEWRGAIADPTEYVATQARATDVLIVGTGSRAENFDPVRELDPAEFLVAAGRPALIIPDNVESFQPKCIMIAWKDRREARRAVLEALPLLRLCKAAVVVAIDEGDDLTAAQTAVNDVSVWLGRHGVKAVGRVLPLLDQPAAQLEAFAKEQGADLIVAGAYGYSRWRELVLGGMTRDLLMRMPLCMFLSH